MSSTLALRQDLETLTGPEAAGRLSGTAGAFHAAQYLRVRLAEAGYAARLQPLDVPAARLERPARLEAAGRALAHRREFAEWGALSGGGSVTGRLLVTTLEDALPLEAYRGRVVLIAPSPQGFDAAATARAAAELGVAALLVEQGEPEWFHKGVYGGAGKIPVVRLRAGAADALKRMDGERVALDLPLGFGPLPCNNVLGWLPAAGASFTLALTAHYDHVGDDPSGARFPGALDNASGVAAVLEAARRLGHSRPPFNVLVAFLTGEESGLWGARQLAAHPPAALDALINLDGLGAEPKLETLRLGHAQRGGPLAELAGRVLLESGIQAQWVAGRDDSSAFIAAGIPTVGLGEQRGAQVMHTPLDTLERLHVDAVMQGVEALLQIATSIREGQIKEEQHVYAK